MDEMVKSIDALSRAQFRQLVMGAGAGAVRVPLLLPGGGRGSVPLAPAATLEDVRFQACYICMDICLICLSGFELVINGKPFSLYALPGWYLTVRQASAARDHILWMEWHVWFSEPSAM